MKNIVYIILVSMLPSYAYTQTAPPTPKNVAIFLYENVELLDFAGPGEVFSAAGFDTFTVSTDGKELTSQGFVKIQPEYSLENVPAADIIVLPGGNSGPSANDPKVIEWVKKHHRSNAHLISVCTGVFILANAGLLENQFATTHHGAMQRLRDNYSTINVIDSTRWVDNGFMITTAGVSAGIDGSLHLVSRIKGQEAAKRVARYMQYDKWDPGNGSMKAVNPLLVESTKKLITANGGGSANFPTVTQTSRAPFIGEYINLAQALEKINKNEDAIDIVEAGLQVYPRSAQLYNVQASIFRKLGKPAPISEHELTDMMQSGKVDKAIARLEEDKKKFPHWQIFSEEAIKAAGYNLLLAKKDFTNAIKVFELNTKEFPNSADAFDSLGEALLAAGNRKEAIQNYKIAASMGYENAKKVLEKLNAE
jgi:putative intracellular protease/amidase